MTVATLSEKHIKIREAVFSVAEEEGIVCMLISVDKSGAFCFDCKSGIDYNAAIGVLARIQAAYIQRGPFPTDQSTIITPNGDGDIALPNDATSHRHEWE